MPKTKSTYRPKRKTGWKDYDQGTLPEAWQRYCDRARAQGDYTQSKSDETDDFRREFIVIAGPPPLDRILSDQYQTLLIDHCKSRTSEILYTAIQGVLGGEEVPGVKIDIGKRNCTVQFIVPIGELCGERKFGRRFFEYVPQKLISRLCKDRTEYIGNKVAINDYIIESMAPVQIKDTIVGMTSNPQSEDTIPLSEDKREVQALLEQHFIDHAETATDLCRFHHRFKGTDRVEDVILATSKTVIAKRLYLNSIEDTTRGENSDGLRGKAAMDFKNGIIEWGKQDLLIPWRRRKSKGKGLERRLLQGHKIIRDYCFESGKPLWVEVSVLLLEIDREYKFKLLPDNLREVWNAYRLKSEGKRQITRSHKIAWWYVYYLMEQEPAQRRVVDLMENWQIPAYAKDPAKKWRVFNEILEFLIDTDLILKVKRIPNAERPDKIRFTVNPAMAPHVSMPKRLQLATAQG